MLCADGLIAVLLKPADWVTLFHRIARLFPGATERYLETVADATRAYGQESPQGLRTVAGLEIACGLLVISLARRD